MDLKTKFATAFLVLVALAAMIGTATLFIVEPSAMIPVAFVGFFFLMIWAIGTVGKYYENR